MSSSPRTTSQSSQQPSSTAPTRGRLRRVSIAALAIAGASSLLAGCSKGPGKDNAFDDALKNESPFSAVTLMVPTLFPDTEEPIDFYAIGCPGFDRTYIQEQLAMDLPDFPEEGAKEGEQLLVLANNDGWYEVKNIPTQNVDLCNQDVIAGVYHPARQAMNFSNESGKWRLSQPIDSFFEEELNSRAAYGDNVIPSDEETEGTPAEGQPAEGNPAEGNPAEGNPQTEPPAESAAEAPATN